MDATSRSSASDLATSLTGSSRSLPLCQDPPLPPREALSPTRSASATAVAASTSRRAPAPRAVTRPPASASRDRRSAGQWMAHRLGTSRMGPTSLGGGGAPSAAAHAHGGTILNRCCYSAVLESPSTAAVVWLSLCYGYNLPLMLGFHVSL
ncbi:uncharacterized protein [Aegilops tauschii subsp. strangulata]|uniref:uncharacterized protein isoform X1 n=1 Tax=Aegilops tauschii subsp. strangulata TaxID=200361 RepID=UPI00098AD42B|nr:uncharacterized protein LOC109753990 [Aegilops tauschii subsp. strangulata]